LRATREGTKGQIAIYIPIAHKRRKKTQMKGLLLLVSVAVLVYVSSAALLAGVAKLDGKYPTP